MKTDELVTALSRHLEPVDRGLIRRTVGFALAVAIVGALCVAALWLGVRTDFVTAHAAAFLIAKLAFAVTVIGVASVYLMRLSRPGGELGMPSFWAFVPFAAIILLAAASLGSAPSSHWNRMILGDEWLECLLSIPVIAIVPFAVLVWAVRKAAPTNLVRTGAFTGLVAGGTSALAYALHCTDDSLPFIAAWYGGTILLCTIAGAVLAPRLLRW
ncbi:DUF1109 domain-containing protein [Bradyrhizobium neotropicale]|uniref:Anti-sigma F factor n=1 Tax=Bradyrhizobium neotropicale TaxID=1497615 RepID=A0A176ZDB8_9BRAD|nr:DUF1109 domain-containing protein [Bradyrhizobium neotropicale]OAF17833.1 hypothetical protein AXW67_06855 [Bradyrhizobium neotropicale]